MSQNIKVGIDFSSTCMNLNNVYTNFKERRGNVILEIHKQAYDQSFILSIQIKHNVEMYRGVRSLVIYSTESTLPSP